MIAETLAGIALVKQSVDFIKSQIDTCNDISAIAGSIDGLFRGVDEANQDRNKRIYPKNNKWGNRRNQIKSF